MCVCVVCVCVVCVCGVCGVCVCVCVEFLLAWSATPASHLSSLVLLWCFVWRLQQVEQLEEELRSSAPAQSHALWETARNAFVHKGPTLAELAAGAFMKAHAHV